MEVMRLLMESETVLECPARMDQVGGSLGLRTSERAVSKRLAVVLATSLADWTNCLLATGLEVLEEARRQALHRAEDHETYLGVSCHLNASIQELIKVLAELPRGGRQLVARSPGGVDDLACRVVEFSCCVVQITLGLLEGLTAGRELQRQDKRQIGHTAVKGCRPELGKAGSQVFDTLSQLHRSRLISHCGNG
ncbi:hypothetical protein EYF80_032764 [Liparis tanakae]|uniref:Uncharacterized protein n=1 Tax=Liparis tanakae TaxID=230148 RepID=A0A4Z2GW96_9TELE|nr:hypothetical protein EYF80_032764 [Liparis tanakae]